MDLFNGAEKVRLRSHLSKYLVANEDAEHVFLDKRFAIPGSVWTAEYVVGDSAAPIVRLKSCYGRYLTASDSTVFPSTDARMVLQTVPGCLDDTVGWEPIPDGFKVKLKSHYGSFLSAWDGCLTHDNASHDSATPDWFLWVVNPVDPNLSTASGNAQSSSSPKKRPSTSSTFGILSKKKSPISLVGSPTNMADDDDSVDEVEGPSFMSDARCAEEETQLQDSSGGEVQSSSTESTARQGGGA